MASLKEFLLTLGIPGVVLIAALDSAGIPLPGGPDALVMLISWQRPVLTPFVALAAALGSVLGCYFLYLVGRKSGDVALRSFGEERKERVKERIRRNDWLAVFVAVIGPPPFPTKVFILAAGVVHMSWKRFVVTVFVGRFLRFLGEGYLGAKFGDRAAEILASHYPTIGITLLVGAALVLVVKRFMPRREPDPA
jgi:membrane protein YqaA with SNARE-associated domain